MRCGTCGRNSKPADQCYSCQRKDEEDGAGDHPEILRSCVLVWSKARRDIEALVAQWPGYHEILDPDEPGDAWGARLALHPDGIGAEPREYAIVGGKLKRLPTLAEALHRVL